MKKNPWVFAKFILLPLAAGALSAFFSRGAYASFAQIRKPAIAPPGWLFPVVWTILYILMGIASWLCFVSEGTHAEKKKALAVYGLQLFFNFFWSIFFFRFEWYLFAFLWLVLLWLLIIWCIVLFDACSKAAGWLMVPYLAWVTFAGYLNLSIYLLNKA